MRASFFITIIALLSLSCMKDRLIGDGNIITQERSPGSFTGIHSEGATPVHLSYGTAFNVEVRGSSNLVPRYKTKVFNGVLHLGYDHVQVRHDDIEVFITLPSIESATMSGSGSLEINGSFPDLDRFRLTVSGSSKTIVEDMFRADEVNVNISGSGDVNLERIQSKKGDVKISGSGEVRMNAEETLKVRISGSGKVYYTGNAVVDSKVSGSGEVIKF
jgi:hypothetical protein